MDSRNEPESPVVGILTSIFTDAGPQVVFNSTTVITDDQALNLSVRVMTLLGEQIGRSSFDLFGPLPIPADEEYLCFIFSFIVEAVFTTDPRLKERPTIICIIFKRSMRREMSRAQGLIQSYISQQVTKDFKTESDLKDNKKMNEIHDRLSALISSNPVQIFIVEGNSIQEHIGSLHIPHDAFVIADPQKSLLYIVFEKFLSSVRKREIVILADGINEKKYRRRLKKEIVDSEESTTHLLNYYGLSFRNQY
ncbi:MAG: hypothetical protein ACFFFG_10765 [Candidatus Thorarchaeota archaeon]